MSISGVVVQHVGDGNFELTVRFLSEWLTDGEAEAREYLVDHVSPSGASVVAVREHEVVGIAAVLWESSYAGFRDHGIPLVHQLLVAEPFRRQRVATLLMDETERMAHDRGVATLGITVGLFDEYGPAQRLYGRRGYVPDGRGACLGQRPLGKGTQVRLDDDVIIWLTKDLAG